MKKIGLRFSTLPWPARILFALFAAAAGLELIYATAIFIFLSTPLFDKIVALDPKELSLSFERGWSFVPGLVHVKGVALDGEDPNVIWKIRIPEGDVRVRARDLFRKTLHLTKVDAIGLSFEVHVKTQKQKALWPSGPDTQTLEEKKAARWKVHLEGVELRQASRIQIEDWVYRGPARASGGFFLWPGLLAEVGPAEASLSGGEVTLESPPLQAVSVMKQVRAYIETKFYPFLPYETDGAKVFDYLTAKIDMKADVGSLEWINRLLIRNELFHLESKIGPLAIHLAATRGRLEPESRFSFKSAEMSLLVSRLKLQGHGSLTGAFAPGNRARLKLDFQDYALRDNLNGKRLAFGPKFLALVDSSDTVLKNFFENRRFDLKLSSGVIPTNQNWAPYLSGAFGKHFSFNPGTGSFSARVLAQDGPQPPSKDPREGYLRIDLRSLRSRVGPALVRGDFQVKAGFGIYDLQKQRGRLRDLTWRLDAQNADAGRFKNSEIQPVTVPAGWWATGSLKNVSFGLKEALRASGDANFRCKDTLPFLDVYRRETDEAAWKTKLFELGPMHASTEFRIDGRRVGLHNMILGAGPLFVRGEASGNLPTMDALFILRHGLIKAGVKLSEGDSELKLFPSQEWIRRSATELNLKSRTLL